MYSNEIDALLKRFAYQIPQDLYIRITHSSPQLDHILYNPDENTFNAWTTDGYYWKFSVEGKEN